jgi:hypothetical protein
MEKSISDAQWLATKAGWVGQGNRMFCPEHHAEAASPSARRPSPKVDALVAIIAQHPGLGARALAEILAGGHRVSAVRVNQVGSLLRMARLRGYIVQDTSGWCLAQGVERRPVVVRPVEGGGTPVGEGEGGEDGGGDGGEVSHG